MFDNLTPIQIQISSRQLGRTNLSWCLYRKSLYGELPTHKKEQVVLTTVQEFFKDEEETKNFFGDKENRVHSQHEAEKYNLTNRDIIPTGDYLLIDLTDHIIHLCKYYKTKKGIIKVKDLGKVLDVRTQALNTWSGYWKLPKLSKLILNKL